MSLFLLSFVGIIILFDCRRSETINGKECSSADIVIVDDSCQPNSPHFDQEGDICANDGTATQSYCSYEVNDNACAYCDDGTNTVDSNQEQNVYFPTEKSVFGIRVIATENVNINKVKHAMNVMYQYLDNNEDGIIDDPSIVDEMISVSATLAIFKNEDEAESFFNSDSANQDLSGWQDLYDDEIIVDSCSFDRDNANCNDRYDGSLEEVLHLITGKGVSRVYENVWGESFDSVVGKMISSLNGDCGWGYLGNWKDPNSDLCDGVYAYDDETCDEECIVTEGIYWALSSVLESQNYEQRATNIASEWLLSYPTGNASECDPLPHCRVMQQHAPDLYALMTNYSGWKWLPQTLPNGNYSLFEFDDESKANSFFSSLSLCSMLCSFTCVIVFG